MLWSFQKRILPCLVQLLVVSRNLYCSLACSCSISNLCLQCTWHSPCGSMSVCPNFPLLIRTAVKLDLLLILIIYNLILTWLHLQRLYFSIASLSQVPGRHEFGENTIQPVQRSETQSNRKVSSFCYELCCPTCCSCLGLQQCTCTVTECQMSLYCLYISKAVLRLSNSLLFMELHFGRH